MTNEITDYTPVFEILEDIFGEYKNHNDYKCQVSFDCPVCSHEIKGLDEGDGKGNLEINYKSGVYKCWSCGETHDTHGSIYKLIKKYGNKKHLKNYLLLRPEDNEDITKKTFQQIKLPKEFISFTKAGYGIKLTPQYKQALNYVKKRNITDEMLLKYNIGFCYEGEYAFRIIIPSYDENGTLNYFIARSYLSKPKMKYKNPEAQKEIIIFNEYLINWTETIYIVEGAFDSIFISNAIPMLGKFMSEHLYSKLYEKAFKIIIILDPDAWGDAEKLYHKLNCGKLMNKVWIIKLEGDKDLADLEGKIDDYKLLQLE
jgi:DNA primase